MGQGWPETQLGHEVGSSGAAVEMGLEGLGRSVAAGWQEGAKSQSRLRVCSWLMQYTLCTNWLISPLSWQRPHQVQAPRQGKGHRGEGQARPTPSWHSRGKGEEVPMAPPDTKNVERIL